MFFESVQMKKELKLNSVIHIFAVLHATVTILCALAGVSDELLLTILTMTLILIICIKNNMKIEVTAACIIICNILGYFLGVFGAKLFGFFIPTAYIASALATFCTTEIMGWSLTGFSDIFHFKPEENDSEASAQTMLKSGYFKWLALAIIGVFLIRMISPFLTLHGGNGTIGLTTAIGMTLNNTISLIILTALNVMFIFNAKIHSLKFYVKVIVSFVFILTTSVLETLMVTFGLPLNFSFEFEDSLIVIFEASALLEMMMFCLIFLMEYSVQARNQAREAKEKANLAQYRYAMLKQQLNPHFLFNSLNALDCLVCEDKAEEASVYIHKLAGVYRYLLKSEEEQFVSLGDEMKFVEMYNDLFSVRFPTGYELHIDIPVEKMSRMVIPCSIQLLVENAFKHNVIGGSTPLTIRIEYRAESIVVSNNIMPKKSNADSTGLGIKYIRRQYSDLTDKNINIENNNETYTVTLPLL